MAALAQGIEEESRLRNAGFGDAEVEQWKAETAKKLYDGGFTEVEVKGYFGQKEPDMAPMRKHIEENLQAASHPELSKVMKFALEPLPPILSDDKKGPAENLIEAVQAGWQGSVAGLIDRKKAPDLILPEHAPMFYRIASQVGQFAGDLPAMVPGMVMGGAAGAAVGTTAGAAAGTVVPVAGTIGGGAVGGAVGAVSGAAAGGFALPTAIRGMLMDHYEKGDIKDFGDFWERSSAILLDTLKSGAVGAVTGMAGKATHIGLGSVASPAVATAGMAAAEVGTMTTLGKAMEGQIPTADDFVESAIFIGGLHATSGAISKLRGIYAKTGMHPNEVAKLAEKDVILKQELLTEGREIPSQFGGGELKPPPFELPAPKKEAAAPEPASGEPSARDKVLSHIGVKVEPESPDLLPKLYADVVDKAYPIKVLKDGFEVEGKKILPTDDPYLLVRQFVDHKGVANAFLTEGQVDFRSKQYIKDKPSFKQILDQTKGEVLDFEADLIARRVQELGKENNLGFDREAIDAVRKQNGKKFDKPAAEFVEWKNSGLKYAADAGVVSQDGYKKMVKAGAAYLPLKVLSEDGVPAGKKKPVQKMSEEGSTKKKLDPLVTATDDMALLVQMAEKNRAIDAAVRLFGEDAEIMERVGDTAKPIKIDSKEVLRILKENGIENPDPATIEAATIFRKMRQNEGPNDITHWVDGKPEVWRFKDPDVARAFKSMDGSPATQAFFMKALVLAKNTLRAGVTTTLEFVGRNSWRDNLFSATTTGSFPYVGILDAMGELAGKKGAYRQWLISGGANSAFVELGENWILKNYPELNRDPQGFLKKTWNRVETAKEYMEMLSNVVENGPRLKAYKNVVGEATDLNTRLAGGMASREVTVDFQKGGGAEFVQKWTAVTAFMNPAIQGIDRSIRALTSPETRETAFKMGFATITAPVLTLWALQKDDPRWDELPYWEKFTHLILLTDNWQPESYAGQAKDLAPYLVRKGKNGGLEINHGVPFKLPLPQELGVIFGAFPLLLAEKFHKDNPLAGREFIESSLSLMTPNFLPTGLSPIAEQAVNKSFFTGNQLVGDHLKKELPQYRYTHYTSETAKAIGSLIGHVPYLKDSGPDDTPLQSPAVIENYIQGYAGTLGKYIVQLSDWGMRATGNARVKNPPSSTLKDLPVIRGFVSRWPQSNTQSIVQFRESYKGVAQFWESYQRLQKEDPAEAEHLLSSQENSAFMFQAEETHKALNEIFKAVNQIATHPDYSGNEKRQLIDTLLFQATEIAKEGNKQFKEAFEQGQPKKEAKVPIYGGKAGVLNR